MYRKSASPSRSAAAVGTAAARTTVAAAVTPAVSAGPAAAPGAGPWAPRRHARALLIGVAPALLAGGLDLGQEPVVLGPLDADLLADELLDRLERQRARFIGEADGLAGGARARGAADAVDVVLGVLGQVPVDDVGDALDV